MSSLVPFFKLIIPITDELEEYRLRMNWSRCQLPTPFTKCPNCKNEAQKEETRTGVQGTPPYKTSHLRAIPSLEQANSEIPALTLCYQPRGPPGPGVSGPGPRSRLRSERRVRMLKEIQPRLFLPARQARGRASAPQLGLPPSQPPSARLRTEITALSPTK